MEKTNHEQASQNNQSNRCVSSPKSIGRKEGGGARAAGNFSKKKALHGKTNIFGKTYKWGYSTSEIYNQITPKEKVADS